MSVLDGVLHDHGSRYAASVGPERDRAGIDALLADLRRRRKLAKAKHHSWAIPLSEGIPLKGDDGETGACAVIWCPGTAVGPPGPRKDAAAADSAECRVGRAGTVAGPDAGRTGVDPSFGRSGAGGGGGLGCGAGGLAALPTPVRAVKEWRCDARVSKGRDRTNDRPGGDPCQPAPPWCRRPARPEGVKAGQHVPVLPDMKLAYGLIRGQTPVGGPVQCAEADRQTLRVGTVTVGVDLEATDRAGFIVKDAGFSTHASLTGARKGAD